MSMVGAPDTEGRPISVGRVLRNRRFMPWLTIRLSAPISADIATDWRSTDGSTIARPMPMRCQMSAEVAEEAGALEDRIGDRISAQPFELRVAPVVERFDCAHATSAACCNGASTAASSGSPPNAGHHCWNEHDEHSAPGRGRKSPVVHARSTAFHTAVVRVVMNFTDCADGSAVMVSPVLRYISLIADGRRPSTSSHRNE